VALLDAARQWHGDDPALWLPVLLQAVQDRKLQNARSAE